MSETIHHITTQLTRQLQGWLDEPSETTAQIDELRSKVMKLGDTLGPEGLKATLKALQGGESQAHRERQREAADVIAAACRPLGIILDVKPPPKRIPKKRASKSEASPPQLPATAIPTSTETSEDRNGGIPQRDAP